ncbi:MAG TPA: S8/S53 family peptidase [Trueperaceae bacterium]|nr:S8/S53 family peptidase [Trueperaceae bacterium]
MRRILGRLDRSRLVARSVWRQALVGAAILLFMAACQTTPQPEALSDADAEYQQALELGAFAAPTVGELRVRFLPPIGKAAPSGEFESGLALEIEFFNVDPVTRVASGSALGPELATPKQIAIKRDVYSLVWRSFATTVNREAGQYLRLEVRLPTAPDGPACNEPTASCLGYVDLYTFSGRWQGPGSVPEGFVPVPATRGALPIKFKVLVAPDQKPAPDTIDELTGVNGGSFSTALGNCVSSFQTRPSQGLQAVGAGLQAVGAIGGMFRGPSSAFGASLISAAGVADELSAALVGGPTDKNVALFIVDDFSEGLELPPALFGPDPDLEALASQVSHGALVLHHVKAMAEVLVGNSAWGSGYVGDQMKYYLTDANGNHLFIQTIDVGNYDTDDIPAKVRYMLAKYGASYSSLNTHYMVVNMSFAVVPCSVQHDFANTVGLATFEDYVAALASVNGIGDDYLSDLGELVSLPVNVANDPLLTYLGCPLPTASSCDGADAHHAAAQGIVHVASSGNYGNAYALFPAASPLVISVGSSEPSSGGYVPAAYSNAAEVAAPGGLFELANVNDNVVAYAGSSFAAPIVSLYLALDMMQDHARCPVPQVSSQPLTPPRLATGVYDMLPFYTPFAYDGEDALSEYCVGPS